MTRMIEICSGTFWNGVPITPTSDLSLAVSKFRSGFKIGIPMGTYSLVGYDKEIALLQPLRNIHSHWAKFYWVAATEDIIPRPAIYSKELPIVVDGQKLDRPAFHHDAPPLVAKLWRYMPFKNFERMLEQGGVFLSRADRFPDALEGTLSSANERYRNQIYPDNPAMAQAFCKLRAELLNMKRWTYVSCWRLDEVESFRCWNEYASVSGGIAIQTTYLQIAHYTSCIFCAKVRYVDFNDTWIIEGNSLMPFIHKDRKQFEWENEFRIIVQQFPEKDAVFDQKDYYDCEAENPEESGKVLKVNLQRFVKQIVIAPGASTELRQRIEKLAAKLGLRTQLRNSSFF